MGCIHGMIVLSPFDFCFHSVPHFLSEPKSIPNLTVCLYREKLHGCQLLLKIGDYLSISEEDPDRKH